MQLGYLVHNLNDAAVERRCRMLNAGGAEVSLAGFCRDDVVGHAAQARDALMLDQSHDAALAARAIMAVKHGIMNGALREHFRDCHAIIARNLEQLAIAARLADGRPLIYECLDIHRALLSKSFAARVIQILEAALLRRSDLLITSSPAFIRNHFGNRIIKGGIVLVENKLLLDPVGSSINRAERVDTNRPITVGWFGMLRCRRTLEFLTQLAVRSNGKVEVLIAGRPSPAELPHLKAQVDRTEGMRFVGPYTYTDLPELYGQCDLAWSVDWFEEGLNSKWLLPNRIYEAIAYGCVPIALCDVEVGRWLKERGAGLVVKDAGEASDLILGLTSGQLADLRKGVDHVDRGATICSEQECIDLVRTINGLVSG